MTISFEELEKHRIDENKFKCVNCGKIVKFKGGRDGYEMITCDDCLKEIQLWDESFDEEYIDS